MVKTTKKACIVADNFTSNIKSLIRFAPST